MLLPRPRGVGGAIRLRLVDMTLYPPHAARTRQQVARVRGDVASLREGAWHGLVDGSPHVEEEAADLVDDRRVGDLAAEAREGGGGREEGNVSKEVRWA